MTTSPWQDSPLLCLGKELAFFLLLFLLFICYCSVRGAEKWIRVGFECFLFSFSKLCLDVCLSLVRDGDMGARPSCKTGEGGGTLEYSSPTSCSQHMFCSNQEPSQVHSPWRWCRGKEGKERLDAMSERFPCALLRDSQDWSMPLTIPRAHSWS